MRQKLKTNIELFVINRVRAQRLEQKLSQDDIAVMLDTTRGFIGQVESPKHSAKYNLNHLNKLAIEFGCPLYDFLPENPIVEKEVKKHAK